MNDQTTIDVEPDRNADLIGLTFQGDEGELTITGPMPGNSAYVLCEPGTCRRVSDVRLMLA